jgi:hypothetical protein
MKTEALPVPDDGLDCPPSNDRAVLSRLPDPCTSTELATVLGKSPKTIVDWCQERAYTHIPCFRLGNRWYHRVPELMRWLNGIKSGHVEFRRRPRNSAERK